MKKEWLHPTGVIGSLLLWTRKVADELFTAVSSDESNLGDRVEAVFNISFWAKEQAIDWQWLGLISEKERLTDELVAAMEMECFKLSERDLLMSILDCPWPCAMAVVRTLQMCELTEKGVLQMPESCPWCMNTVAVKGWSLYSQITAYLAHMSSGAACVHAYTGVKGSSGQITSQVVPHTVHLRDEAARQEVNNRQSSYVVCNISRNGYRQ